MKAVVTARIRMGFRECGEIMFGKQFFFRIKGKVYKSSVTLASYMLYGSETCCLRENKVAILRRAERSMVRAMCGVKLVNKKKTVELMGMLKLKEAADKLAKENGVRWYGHALRRPEEDVLMKAIVHEMNGKRIQDQPKMKWREQVEENTRRIG